MTNITAKDVSDLRKATGAGLMDCKKALVESGGNMDGAVDYLRKKGQKVAAKRADREVKEGVVVIIVNDAGTKGLVMALSCETDFVAKNENFIELANRIAKLGFDNNITSIDALTQLPIDGMTVAEKLVDYTGTIGEKITVSDYKIVEGERLAWYIHSGSKIGVIVSYKDGGKNDEAQFFRSVAMHIAAMNPLIMHPNEFDDAFVVQETESLQGQIKIENEDRKRLGKPLRNVPQFGSRRQLSPEVMAKVEEDIKAELRAEGKPEKIFDKIVPGKLERFYADNTLVDQERCLMSQFFALDDTKSVETAVKEFHENAEIVEFKRVAVG